MNKIWSFLSDACTQQAGTALYGSIVALEWIFYQWHMIFWYEKVDGSIRHFVPSWNANTRQAEHSQILPIELQEPYIEKATS